MGNGGKLRAVWKLSYNCALGVSGFHPVLWRGHSPLCRVSLNLVSFLSHFGQNSSLMSSTLESPPQNFLWDP